ncbi:alpha-(1,3)-fucosyltransferase C [Culex quinquefasciatus]|uniref:alpha-(1,3)-fucosyltransferase C n=1 Tax=Culex quinquefasciatus TaxID=7176 RepID=UPI0018E3AD11|nr:alpha-(1,3)-fucosyltransferase C [Culex quinquefasciatus]
MKNVQRGRFAIGLAFGVSLFLYCYYNVIFDNCAETCVSYDQLVDERPEKNNTKYILTYTNFFTSNNWFLNEETVGEDFFRYHQCPETDCVVTSRQDLLPSIAYFDALVFHGAEEWRRPIPTLRSPSQLYVAAIKESPAHTKRDLAQDVDFYNWTMTYRADSDVLWTYGQLSEIGGEQRVVAPSERTSWPQDGFQNYTNQALLGLVRNKTKMAAQFVSHCGAVSGRDRLVKAIQKAVKVDVYGKCGTMECPPGSPRCTRMLTDDYRFYFAFENSLCRDYVTEKLFNAMESYIIPVVFGGADYSKFVPPHSVIDVQEFGTVKELVNYLRFLADNPEEYVKYFWWKEQYRVTRSKTFCELCRMLHGIGAREKSQYYKDIREWWFEGACQVKAKIEF